MQKFLRTLALMAFLAVPWAANAQALNEGFETWPAEGWTALNVSGTSQWQSNSSHHSGTKCASINYASSGHDNYLISPQFTPVAGQSLSFWVSAQNYGGTTLTIEVSTTDATAAAFTNVLATYTSGSSGTLGTTTTSNWVEKNIDLSDFAGQNIYIAFHVVDDNGARINIDDVESHTCSKPTDFAADQIEARSLRLTWQNSSTPLAYEVSYGTVKTIVTGTTYEVTGLTPETSYTFSLRAICAEGDTLNAVTCNATTDPTCFRPHDLVATDVQAQSLTLKWCDTNNTGADYILTYELLGKKRTVNIEGTTDDTMTYDVTNLRPETNYTFYLRTVCGEGDSSSVASVWAHTLALCNPVTSLTASATSSSVTLNWTASLNTGVKYRIVYVGPDGEHVIRNITTTTRTIRNLEPNTYYEFFVYTDCTDELSSDAAYTSINTLCDPISLADAATGFENGFDCWNTAGGNISVYYYSYYAHNGDQSLRFYGSTAGVAIMPALVMPATNGVVVNFWARPSSAYSLEVGYITDINDPTTFVSVVPISLSGSSYTSQVARLENIPANARVAFRYAGASSYAGVYVDDISLEPILSCEKPENLAVVPTGDGGNLTWDAVDGVSEYVVYVDGEEIARSTTNSYTINTLQGSSSYTVGVASVCSDGITPMITETLNTLCPVAELPLTFNASDYALGTEFPACWIAQDYPSINSGDVLSIVSQDGQNAIRFASYSTNADVEQYLISPEFPTEGVKQLTLGGVKVSTSYSSSDALYYGYSSTDNNENSFTWNLITKTNSYADYTYEIPSGAKYVALKYTGHYAYRYFVRSINLLVQPSCDAPTDLAVSGVTTTSAQLSWTAVDGVSEYVVVVNGEEQTPRATTNSYTLSNLTAATSYTVGVKAVCPAGDITNAAQATFATLCDAIVVDAENPFTEGFESAAFPPDCWNKIDAIVNNTNHSWSTYASSHTGSRAAYSGYYGDIYLMMPPLQIANSDLSINLKFWDKNTYASDYDKNSVVVITDDGETELWSPASASTSWNENTIDLSAYKGQTITLAFKYEGNNAHGWYVDDVKVAFAPNCIAPAIANVNGDAGRSAEVTLELTDESLGNEVNYQYVVMPAGETADWTAAQTADALTFNVAGLEPQTSYTLYVRANCGETDGASDVVSSNFTTGISCFVPSNGRIFDVHNNNAKFSWEGDASQYEFLISTTNDIATATSTVVNAKVYAPELQPLTTYYAWVRAICGEGDTSDVYALGNVTTYCTYNPCYVNIIAIDTVAADGWQEAQVDLYQDGRLMGSATLSNGDSSETHINVCAEVGVDLILRKGYFDEENAIAIFDQNGTDLYHNNRLDIIANGGRIGSFASPCPNEVPPVEYKLQTDELCINATNTSYVWNMKKVEETDPDVELMTLDLSEYLVGNDTTVQFTHFVTTYEAEVLQLAIHHAGVEAIEVRVCDEYTWNDYSNLTYTKSIVDTFTYDASIRSFFGCDSIAVLTLTIDSSKSVTIDSTICANDLIWDENLSDYRVVLNGTEDTINLGISDRYFNSAWETGEINASNLFDVVDPETGDVTPAFTTEAGCYLEKKYNFTINPIIQNFIDTAACYTFTWDRTGNSWSFDRETMFEYAELNNVDTAYSVDETTGCMVMDILSVLRLSDTVYRNDYVDEYGYFTFHGQEYTNNSVEENMYLSLMDTTESTAEQCAVVTYLDVTIHPFTTLHHYVASNDTAYQWIPYYDENNNPVTVTLRESGEFTKTEYRHERTGNTHIMHYTKLEDIAPVCDSSDFSFDIVDGEGNSHTLQGTFYSNSVIDLFNADSNSWEASFNLFDREAKTITFTFTTEENRWNWHRVDNRWYGDAVDTIFKGQPVQIKYIVKYNTLQTVDSTVAVCDNAFPYTWNGQTFEPELDDNNRPVYTDAEGILTDEFGEALVYEFHASDANGCDSTTFVRVKVLPTVNLDTVVAACSSFTWRGTTYTESGDYSKVLGSSANGCDSIMVMHLTINQPSEGTATFYAEGSYNLNVPDALIDTIYTNSNTTFGSADSVYTREYVIRNVSGCDSTISATVTVFPTVDMDSNIVSSTGNYFFNGTLYTIQPGQVSSDYDVTLPYKTVTLESGETLTFGEVRYHIHVGSTSEYTDNVLDQCGMYTWNRNGITYFSLTEEEQDAHANCTYKYRDTVSGEFVFVDPNMQPYVIDTTSTNPDVIANGGFAVRYRLNLVLAPAKFYTTVKDNYPLSLGSFSMYEQTFAFDKDTTYEVNFTKDTTGAYCKVINNVILNVVNNFDTIDTVLCANQTRLMWGGVNNVVRANAHSITLTEDTTVLVQFMENIDTTSYIFTYRENEGTEQELVHSVRVLQYPSAFKTDNLQACDSLTWDRNGVTYTESTNSAYIFGIDETVGCNVNYMLNLTLNDKVYVTDTAVCDSLVWHGMTFYRDTVGAEYLGQSGSELFYPTNGYGEACSKRYVLNLTVYNSERYYTEMVNDVLNENGERAMTMPWMDENDLHPIEGESIVVEEGSNYKVYRDSVMRESTTANGCPIYDVLLLTVYGADTAEAPIVKHFCENDEGTFTVGNKTFNKDNASGYAYVYTGTEHSDSVYKVEVTYGNITYENIDTVFSGEEFVWVVNGDTVNTFDHSGNYRSEYTSTETFCPVVALMNLTLTDVEYLTLRERQLPYTYTNEHGAELVITEAGEYRADWAEDDADNIALNGKGYNRVVVTVNPMQTASVDTLICWYPTYVMNAGDIYGNGQYIIDETVSFNLTAATDTTVHAYATDILGTQDYDVTFNLSVRDTHNIVNNVVSCAAYYWDYDENIYSEDTVVSYPSTDIFGCPNTITLNYRLGSETIVEVPVTACGSYVLNDVEYTESTDVTVPGPVSEQGCNTSTIYHITIYNVEPTATVETVCGDSYTWNNNTYTQSGEYTVMHLDAQTNCPVVDTLRLTLNAPINAEETAESCGEYTWNGETYTSSGDYTADITDVNGCAATATLHLTINTAQTETVTATACGSYEWNGQTYDASGSYTYTTTAANGCDSIVTLQLTVLESVAGGDSTAVACGSFEWNGEFYTQSGDYTLNLMTANGCDSTVTLHLTINQAVNTVLDVTACDTYTWETNGVEYTSTGTYLYTFENGSAAHCDSTVTLNLTINSSSISTIETTAVGSYEWNGNVYTESGEYTFNGQTVNGCDSVVTLILTIETQTYTVTVGTNNAAMGNVNPAGTFTVAAGETFTATAEANDGFRFAGWSNGATTETVTITVESDTTLTANFEAITYTISATSNDETMGTVLGSGEYAAGATVTLTAVANSGYHFVRWSDGTTDDHYIFTAEADVELVAYFEADPTGIEDAENANVAIYSADSKIIVKGAENMDIYVYDVNGRVVRTQANATETVEFTMNTTGVYLVKVGNAPAKRVVVVR